MLNNNINKINQKAKKNTNKIVLGVFLFLTFFSGWFLGHQDLEFKNTENNPQIINKNGAATSVDFTPFWKTWNIIVNEFDGKIDLSKLMEGAIKGMVGATGDPYTVYMNAEEVKEFESDLSGNFSGIGAEIGIKNDKLTIIAPIDNSPAKSAGLKSGDVILKINDEDTANMSLNTAVSKIRGKEGTDVKLTIQNESGKKDVNITRANIQVVSVKWEMKENKIGYIKLSSFDDNSAEKIKEATNDFVSKGAKGVILDLRDNPGGLLDSAVSISGEFIKDGVVVIEKNRNGSVNDSLKTNGKGKMTNKDIPVVVLANEGSASASEIVAGAIQDTGRGIILGEKTYGKGSVQKIEGFSDGSALRITIAHWYTPKNRSIDKEGLKPDIEVKLTEDDAKNNKDPQLDKALEYIKGKF